MADFFSVYKKQIMILFALIILVIVMYGIRLITDSNHTDRVITNEEIVFTTDVLLNKDSRQSRIPFINLTISGIDEINKEIAATIYEETIVHNRSANYDYYYDEGNILSLLITFEEYMSNDKLALLKYEAYHVDLKNRKILTEEELIQKYDISITDVKEVYEQKMKFFYDEALQEGYVDNYCDFDCYVQEHELENGKDSFWITENGVYYYKDFLMSSILGDETFFENKDLETLIK